MVAKNNAECAYAAHRTLDAGGDVDKGADRYLAGSQSGFLHLTKCILH